MPARDTNVHPHLPSTSFASSSSSSVPLSGAVGTRRRRSSSHKNGEFSSPPGRNHLGASSYASETVAGASSPKTGALESERLGRGYGATNASSTHEAEDWEHGGAAPAMMEDPSHQGGFVASVLRRVSVGKSPPVAIDPEMGGRGMRMGRKRSQDLDE